MIIYCPNFGFQQMTLMCADNDSEGCLSHLVNSQHLCLDSVLGHHKCLSSLWLGFPVCVRILTGKRPFILYMHMQHSDRIQTVNQYILTHTSSVKDKILTLQSSKIEKPQIHHETWKRSVNVSLCPSKSLESHKEFCDIIWLKIGQGSALKGHFHPCL